MKSNTNTADRTVVLMWTKFYASKNSIFCFLLYPITEYFSLKSCDFLKIQNYYWYIGWTEFIESMQIIARVESFFENLLSNFEGVYWSNFFLLVMGSVLSNLKFYNSFTFSSFWSAVPSSVPHRSFRTIGC